MTTDTTAMQAVDTSAAPIALVLGATGGIGGAVAARLAERGYRVRAMHRNPDAVKGADPRFDWVRGDAMQRADVMVAAHGASVIVHAVNPPGYKDWDRLVLPMIDNTIAAAHESGALIVLPGTVYNFGQDAFPLIAETAPQHPISRKGAIRVALERQLEAAASAGTPVLIVRTGDFFGPRAGSTWFDQVVKPGKAVRAVTLPGRVGVPHQWAYLPDVAETMVQLIDRRDELPAFARFHMEGFVDEDGSRLAQAIGRVTGNPQLKVRRFPWWVVPFVAPFVTVFREVQEMRYLWMTDVRLDNRKLVSFLGREPHTPIDEAVRETLVCNGCLPDAGTGREQHGRMVAA